MSEQGSKRAVAGGTTANRATASWLRRHVIKLVVIVLIFGIGGFVAAGPYLTLLRLRSGVEARDTAQVADCVDFPAVRQSLKDQLQLAMSKRANAEVENNPFAALGAAFATRIVDGLVDKLVTPEGLAKLLAGEKPLAESQGAAPANASARKPLGGARYSYESLDRFAISVPTDEGEDIRFILTRSGLQWRLSGIEMPVTK